MSQESGAGAPFLTAEWRHLAMLNWPVPPDLVRPHVPVATELDTFGGLTYISIVGFVFADTRLFGVPVPWHRTFEEVNLRFYVRRVVNGEVRRGVTFVREFVPRIAVAALARWIYNEPYRCVPMASRIDGARAGGGLPRGVWYRAGVIELSVETNGVGVPLEPGSFEQFIAEHYWGYTRTRDGGTMEYRVEHRPWLVAHSEQARLTGRGVDAYGPAFGALLTSPPASAFVADGSPVTVLRPVRIA